MMDFNRRKALIGLTSALILPAVAGCGGRASRPVANGFTPSHFQSWDESAPGYRVYPGDELEVTVHTAPELSGIVTVGPDGRANLPMAGGVMVAERTAREASNLIAQRYTQVLRDPIIEVRPVGFGSQRIMVGGEVNAPGVFDMPSTQMGVLEAVMLAGGPTLRARRSEIVVLRRAADGGVMMRTVNLSRAMQGRAGDITPLSRHDIVFVPRSTIAEVNDFIDQYITGIIPLDSAFAYAVIDAAFNNN